MRHCTHRNGRRRSPSRRNFRYTPSSRGDRRSRTCPCCTLGRRRTLSCSYRSASDPSRSRCMRCRIARTRWRKLPSTLQSCKPKSHCELDHISCRTNHSSLDRARGSHKFGHSARVQADSPGSTTHREGSATHRDVRRAPGRHRRQERTASWPCPRQLLPRMVWVRAWMRVQAPSPRNPTGHTNRPSSTRTPACTRVARSSSCPPGWRRARRCTP